MNYTPPPFQPIRFIPSFKEAEARSHQVWAIYVVGHDRLDGGANHWCFYLQIGAAASVRVDATPTHSIPSTVLQNGSKANIVISTLPYLISSAAQKTVCLSVCANLTVGRVLDLLIQSGRTRYEFNSEGRGCRMWTTDQITLFERQGIATNAAEAAEARNAILSEYPGGKPFPLDVGAYY